MRKGGNRTSVPTAADGSLQNLALRYISFGECGFSVPASRGYI